MKIIRPMDLTASGVESNAPGEGYAKWTTVGRGFLEEESGVVVGATSGTVYVGRIGSSFSGIVRAFDMSTGAEVQLPFSLSNFAIESLNPSPDGGYMGITGYKDGQFSLPVVRFYSLQSGTMLLEAECTAVFRGVSWSLNSACAAFSGRNSSGQTSIAVVDSANWAAPTYISDVVSIYLEGDPGSQHAFPGFDAYGSGVYYSLSSTEFTASGSIKKNIVGNLSVTGSNQTLTIDRVESQVPQLAQLRNLFYNPAKSHVLGTKGGNFYAFRVSDLGYDSDIPEAIGADVDYIERSLDGAEFIASNSSVKPYFREIDSGTYIQSRSFDGAISTLAAETNATAYGSDYIAFSATEGGFGLIDIATGNRVTQTNPTVTKGDIYTYGNRNYEALSDNNDRPDLGAIPVIGPETGDNLATWLDLGYINPLRMLDTKLDSVTTAPSPLTITVTPGMITNGLALFNVSAATVHVVMDDPVEGHVYDSGQIQMLDNSAVNNWWDFFFAPYLEKADLALIDLPPYPDATLTITLSSDGGDVALGELVLGRVQNIGEAQYGTSVGIIDASTKERDVFGNFEIIERKFSKRAEFDVSVPTSSASGMQRILAQYRATPVVWVGNMGLEATIVYGFYRDFQINFSHYSLSDATITVEGL